MGGKSLTSKVIVVELLPALFVAVIVYTVGGERTVGVPLISPVVELIVKPVGKAGEIDHVWTEPPLYVGVTAFIGTFFVSST